MTTYQKNILVNNWIKYIVEGEGNVYSLSFESELEPDGRKRKKTIRELAELGYINIIDRKIHITSKAYDEIQEKEISFSKNLTEKSNEKDFSSIIRAIFYYKNVPIGFKWVYLPYEVKKYILNHPENYVCFYFIWDGEKSEYVKTFVQLGKDFPDGMYVSNLLVKDLDFDAIVEKIVFQEDLEHYRKDSLTYGLVQLGILTVEEVALFETKIPYFEKSNLGFEKDPLHWESNLNTNIDDVKKYLEEVNKYYNVLNKIKEKINERGGWKKFLVDYDQLIHEHLKKMKEEKHGS